MTEKLHAELSASGMERWANCPGSIRMIRQLIAPPTSSIWAAEGSAMHEAAEQWLKFGEEPDWLVEKFGEGIELDESCMEAVRFYVEFLYAERKEHGGSLLVERKFSLENLREGMFGTNDACLVLCTDKVLRVYDFKGGRGVPVEVENNLQLMYYGLGAVIKYGHDKPDAVELVIVQPRCPHRDGPVRRWRVDVLDMADWSQDLLDAAARTDDPHAPLNPGDWCRWCPAAGACPAFKEKAAQDIALDFAPLDPAPLPDPKLLTNAEIGDLLPRLAIAEEWIRLVYAYAMTEAEAGRDIPGYKLVAKRGRRHWISEDPEDVIEAVTRMGVTREQCFAPSAILSPAQMEKLIKKEFRADMGELVEMRSGGATLVPESDPRTPISGTGVQVFAPLPHGNSQELP